MGLLKRLRCLHSNLRAIWGDEIIAAGYRRLRCLDCGSWFKGNPLLAEIRSTETQQGEELMAIRTKRYKSVGGLLEVRAIKITEKNLEDVVDWITRNGGAANGRLARPDFKRPARIRIKQLTVGKTWTKRDWRVALIGDYIVRHEDGDFARVKSGAFNAIYTAI